MKRTTSDKILRENERLRREQELREAERRARREAARLQAVLDAAPAMIWTALDRECRQITGNRAAYEFARVPSGEDLCQTGPAPECLLHHRLFRDGRELAPEERPLQVVARMGRPLLQDSVECVFDDGSVRSVAGNVEPILDAEGNPVGAVAAYVDVTERKKAEEALRASEERFRAAQEVSLDAFTILSAVRDDQGRVVDFRWEFANPEAERILGHGELKGQRLLELLPGNKASSDLFDRYVRVVETGEPHDYEVWYESEGIRGWFRNMTVKIGDGIAVSFSDITKRKQSEQALAEANERLLEADKRKDEFLAMLAHELRNPLAAIVSSAYILEAGELQGRLGRAAGVVRRQSAHMARLLDDLLDVSRVTHGKITLHRERVPLMPAIESAVEAAWPQIESAGHRLSVVGLDPKIEVDGDPVRLAQMVGNLLSNAVKYTPPPGNIQLTVESDGEEVAIRVRDNGIGISPAVLPNVFDLFVQGDNSLARTRGGLGIGLTMVRVLAEMHGGRVEAHSDGPGTGSEFVIRLPLAQAPRQEQASPEPTAPVSRRVLVVDDVADSAEMVSLALEMEGHQVATATSGAQALKVAAEFQPDVILLDLGMPLMDGWEVARRLRQDPQFERVVLVALTGYGQDEDRQRTAEAGFDYHLAKPISIDAINQLLRACRPAGG